VRSTRDIANDSPLVAPLPNFDAFALPIEQIAVLVRFNLRYNPTHAEHQVNQ
jgi:hypothetical protein